MKEATNSDVQGQRWLSMTGHDQNGGIARMSQRFRDCWSNSVCSFSLVQVVSKRTQFLTVNLSNTRLSIYR